MKGILMSTKGIASVKPVTEIEPQSSPAQNEKREEMQIVKASVTSFAPRTFDDAVKFAKMTANATFCPPQLKGKPGDVFFVMQTGAELGISPMQAISGIALINGRASLFGDLFLAVIQKSPDYEWHREWWEGEGEKRVAICQFKRRGQEVHETRFSVADARKAGLWGKAGPWVQYPDRMLQFRSRGFCGRDKFADALKGLIIYEEAIDITTAKVVEHGKLDVAKEVDLLAESTEENRGHGNEGFTQTAIPAPTAAPEAKVEENPEPSPSDAPEATESTENACMRGIVTIATATEHKRKGDKRPYVLLTVTDKASPIYVWHKSLHEFALKMPGREVDLECSPSSQAGVTYWALEVIHRVADCKFENNLPVGAVEKGKVEPEPELKSPVGLFDKGK